MIVNSYGIHFAAGGVGFLLQRGSVQDLYGGGIPCPFILKRRVRGWRSCPHAIDLDKANPAGRELADDPLGRWMLNPSGVRLLHDPTQLTLPLLAKLVELYSPTRSLLDVAWASRNRHTWLEEASVTNVAPWVLADVTSEDMDRLALLSLGAYPRPVLALALEPLPLPPGAKRISTDLRLEELPSNLSALGAWATIQRMAQREI